MVRERVAENVYLFTSDRYASVNAGAVIGPDWSIVIDTLALPEESRQIHDFIYKRLESRVRYVINTHYHADHSFGNCWFPEATVIGHAELRRLLDTRGREGLAQAKSRNRDFRNVEIVLPEIVFSENEIGLQIGKRILRLFSLPGHSLDGIGVLIEGDRVLFSGDIMMPIPFVVDGDFDTMVANMKRLTNMKLESLVQGHGDVILRGEIPLAVKENINYLNAVRRSVRQAGRRKDPVAYMEKVSVEDCGKSRILLNGLAEELHGRNLMALYQYWYGEPS